MLGELSKLAINTDKKTHNYTDIYERFFFDIKENPIKIFEIGIYNGGSLTMWQEYFSKANIFALDIDDKKIFDNNRVKTIIGDQANRDHLQKAINIIGSNIDILIDDGSHTMQQQQVSFGYLFKFINPGRFTHFTRISNKKIQLKVWCHPF